MKDMPKKLTAFALSAALAVCAMPVSGLITGQPDMTITAAAYADTYSSDCNTFLVSSEAEFAAAITSVNRDDFTETPTIQPIKQEIELTGNYELSAPVIIDLANSYEPSSDWCPSITVVSGGDLTLTNSIANTSSYKFNLIADGGSIHIDRINLQLPATLETSNGGSIELKNCSLFNRRFDALTNDAWDDAWDAYIADGYKLVKEQNTIPITQATYNIVPTSGTAEEQQTFFRVKSVMAFQEALYYIKLYNSGFTEAPTIQLAANNMAAPESDDTMGVDVPLIVDFADTQQTDWFPSFEVFNNGDLLLTDSVNPDCGHKFRDLTAKDGGKIRIERTVVGMRYASNKMEAIDSGSIVLKDCAFLNRFDEAWKDYIADGYAVRCEDHSMESFHSVSYYIVNTRLADGKYAQMAMAEDPETGDTVYYTRFVFVMPKSQFAGKSEAKFTVKFSTFDKEYTFTTNKYYDSMISNGITFVPDSEDSAIFAVTVSSKLDTRGRLSCVLDFA
ncbi:MAG: hypothetical protein J5851_07275 [Oscillospiraceae bacterium]|nr:hypothetical protein [Oscillospiraceae bacterium]